jgi:hypothetical protein
MTVSGGDVSMSTKGPRLTVLTGAEGQFRSREYALVRLQLGYQCQLDCYNHTTRRVLS